MIRFTVSADSSDELSRAVDVIRAKYIVHSAKIPRTVKNGRYRGYIFVTEKPEKPVNCGLFYCTPPVSMV